MGRGASRLGWEGDGEVDFEGEGRGKGERRGCWWEMG